MNYRTSLIAAIFPPSFLLHGDAAFGAYNPALTYARHMLQNM
jgi:hypothetical protein